MPSSDRIYLDNAATTWPKPEAVYAAVDSYLRTNGMPWGRTTGTEGEQISRTVAQLRVRIQQLVEASQAQTVFTLNATDALNLAIQGTLRPGDHVVTSVAEHNSVLRPLRTLEEGGKISVSRVECDALGQVPAERVLDAVRPSTRLVALTHCSNVTGVTNDIEAVGRELRSTETLFLVDAAQSLGARWIDFDRCGIDFLAAAGHKGLLGPLGTGLLVVSSRGQSELQPIRQGGTGRSSDSDHHPVEFPEGYEPGNLNVPGLVGLDAGLDFILGEGVEAIGLHKQRLGQRFAERISGIRGIQLVAADQAGAAGIVSFNLPLAASELAAILDSHFRIQIRAGFHCASLLHPRLGTHAGCARISFGYFNTEEHVESAARAIQEIAKAF